MSREIKFRIRLKNRRTGVLEKIHIPLFDESRGLMQFPVDLSEWDVIGIDQYTGLRDRNGKEIYEGDIVKITYDTNHSDKPFYIGFVEYGAEKDYPAFDLNPWIDCEMNALAWLKSETDESVLSYEVIGNIHEHPHLLGDTGGDKG